MVDTRTIQAVLHSLGISISNEEAQRLGPPLQTILADLQKLDSLEKELESPTPGFVVEERHDSK